MGVTRTDEIRAPQSRAYIAASLPTTPQLYYSTATSDVNSTEWRGGEIAINTTDLKVYVQTNTSGTSAKWRRYPTALTAV